ncbi:G-type lectin S-receptor-like serine/threonine-protein kinase At5g35370 [Dioscorea cayenensis subsp. rotundata]|uniref:Receptor-like serine/threonine-protein kinase n=1 Tax=Dioscorea cayennensis subsp. rotundata TaxID=55577 RepID=A0AB40D0F4_DIOCR|nr:G-type lectin S-receptor-like serine/threonine-protein kinase At5g35370 [Dioscorea cayenensis subsp. rotundata]
MANLFLLLLFALFLPLSISGPIAIEFLYPNFTGSYFNYIDNSGGIFLTSPHNTFQAAICNPDNQQTNFYLCVIHALSGTIIWSANRNFPIPNSGVVKLTSSGLTVSLPDGTIVWSTPSFSSPVSSLHILDSGNLLLLNPKNTSLWQSFEQPTDTLVPGQSLLAGSALVSSISTSNLSAGDFRLLLTSDDAVLQWIDSQQYWSLSTDQRANINANGQVSSMSINSSGLYLFSTRNDFEAVMQLSFSGSSDFLIARISSDGRFHVSTYSSATKGSVDLFVAPINGCDLPLSCKSLGICSGGNSVSTLTCTCPNLLSKTSGSDDCLPVDGRVLASPSVCSNSSMLSTMSYMSLGRGTDYFNSKFTNPTRTGVNIASCESLCNVNCSCLGFIYKNSTQDCFILEHKLGSLTSSSTDDAIGYIKIFGSSSSAPQANKDSSNLIAILLPTIAAGLLIVVLLVVVFQWWRRRRTSGIRRKWKTKSMAMKEIHKPWPVEVQDSDDDEFPSDEEIPIPGLPTKFSYNQLQTATANFQTKIGSGGFGEVYKGVLEDKTLVAVKRVRAIGRKKEFFTEIAVIGSVHHINLVRLKGFCAQGSRRMLVYEYMNRGSLEKSLFRPGGPVLEWQERVDIAIGAARGLAYLHSGCEHKIIHCDVKPENILLHDRGQVKISDFGLAKMMTPEQSGLFTTMRGTRGYLAPEWLTNSAISDRTDVYSYGMVLLEIVRGRQNRLVLRSEESGGSTSSGSSSGVGESEYFPLVALDMHEQRRYAELADPRLERRVTGEEVERIVKIALCCLHEDPGFRPSMTAVVGMLEGTMPVPWPRVDLLNFLRFYGRGGNMVGHSGFGNVGVWPRRISNTTNTTSTSESPTYSFLSSQQISGPR